MFLLPHLATVHNFSRRFLHLLQLRNEVPEPGLGNNMIRSKDPHAIERRGPALRRGQASTDYLVLPELEGKETQAAPGVSAAEPPPHPPDAPSPWSEPVEGAAGRAGKPKGRGKPRAQGCAARRSRPPHRGGAASSRVLRERRRRRHVGRSPPSRAMQGRFGAQRPLSSAASPHRRPPDGHVDPSGPGPGPSRAPRAPAVTHGARRLHGAASSAARRKGKAACAAASRHPPAGSPAPGCPLRPLAGGRARLEKAAVSFLPRRPELGSGPRGMVRACGGGSPVLASRAAGPRGPGRKRPRFT